MIVFPFEPHYTGMISGGLLPHLFLLVPLLALACGADLLLRGGRIWRGKGQVLPFAGIAVTGNRIVWVGQDVHAAEWIGPRTQVIDLRGRLVLPGFNDAHLHFLDGGKEQIGLRLRGARSREEFVALIGRYAAEQPGGTWITGGNWDHESWPEGTYPDRRLVDPVTPEHPLFVTRLDGHVALANSLALRLAGITAATPDPPGGEIQREPGTGEPTGILKDSALDLVKRVIPPPPAAEQRRAMEAALQYAARNGVTSVQDMSADDSLPLYQQLLAEGKLTVRVLAVLQYDRALEHLRGLNLRTNFGGPGLRIGALKLFADGSFGAGTALLSQPYADRSGYSGLALRSEQEITQRFRQAARSGVQLCIHAIGDLANERVLNALEQAGGETGGNPLRHRIEHAQLVQDRDILRFQKLRVVASLQPSHCSDDLRWIERRLGPERCRWAYRVRSFLDAAVPVAFGTDWPVEDLNPFPGLYAAVTRQTFSGEPEGGWFPEEKISLDEAIWAYTCGSAFAENQEGEKGRLEPGMLADLIVLNRDPFQIPSREWLHTKVDLTVFDGRVVFDRTGESA